MKPIDSIQWGKKYSLKDRTPQVVLIIFIIFLFGIIFGVNKDDENHPNSSEEVGKEFTQ
jgi:hypothetical protein